VQAPKERTFGGKLGAWSGGGAGASASGTATRWTVAWTSMLAASGFITRRRTLPEQKLPLRPSPGAQNTPGPQLLSGNESLVTIAKRVLELLRHSNGRQRPSTRHA
jgi:hypothetical protein